MAKLRTNPLARLTFKLCVVTPPTLVASGGGVELHKRVRKVLILQSGILLQLRLSGGYKFL